VKVFLRQTNQLQRVGGFLRAFYAKQNERNSKSGPIKLPDGRVWEDFLALQTLELMGLAAL
jgi:hypothetical protein